MPVLILQLDYAKKMGAFDDQKFFAGLNICQAYTDEY